MIMKNLRKESGLTQAEFGKLFGENQQNIQRYESGQRQIPIDLAIKIANHYDVTLDIFFERQYQYHS